MSKSVPSSPHKHQRRPCSLRFTLRRVQGQQSPALVRTEMEATVPKSEGQWRQGLSRCQASRRACHKHKPCETVLCDARLTSERIEARAEQAGGEHRELRGGTVAQATRAVKGQGRGCGGWTPGRPHSQVRPPHPGQELDPC